MSTDPQTGAGDGLSQMSVEVNGVRMNALAGPGPGAPGRVPVVLVHGQGVSSRFMAPSARAFARDFPVRAPDLPGFGLSEKPRQVLDIAGLADALAGFVAACGFERVALVGTSFGWLTAVECALRHPDRVARLVLQGPAAAPRNRALPRLIHRWRQNGKLEPGDTGLLASEYRRAGFVRAFRTLNHFRNYPVQEVLPRVRAPSLIVRGERDRIVSQDWAEQVAAMLPQGKLEVVPFATHTMSRFWPDELARTARPFLLASD